jgi:hypothetical protein
MNLSKKIFLIVLSSFLIVSCSSEEKFGSIENNQNSGSGNGQGNSGSNQENSSGEFEIPAVIENLGFKLSSFDPATGFAGDLKIKGVSIPVAPENDPNKDFLNESYKYLMSKYGAIDRNGPDVQMSFFLPLGTKVTSMVSGTVCDVTKLYSDDVSVRIAPKGLECYPEGLGGASVLFEHEHVVNSNVKYGDVVTAGQVIAEVSDYRKDWKSKGLGIVEIGVFFSKKDSTAPWHACPMKYLAPDKKMEILKDLNSAYVAWESESGNPDLYDETAEFPGCVTMEDLSDSNNASTGQQG